MRPAAAVTVATRYSYSWPWWSRVMVSVDSSRHSTRPAEVAATVRNSWRSCWHTVRSTAFRLAIFIRLRPVARQSGARPTSRVSINRSRRHAVNINKSLVYLERCTAVYRVVLSLSAVSNGRYLGPQPSQVLFDKKLHDDLIVDFYFYGHLSALYLFIISLLFS